MNVTFHHIGLTFVAQVDYERAIPARISGPPEDCYPAEGGTADITALEVEGTDASFLLASTIAGELNDAAYQACVDQIERDREDAAENAAAEREHDRRAFQ